MYWRYPCYVKVKWCWFIGHNVLTWYWFCDIWFWIFYLAMRHKKHLKMLHEWPLRKSDFLSDMLRCHLQKCVFKKKKTGKNKWIESKKKKKEKNQITEKKHVSVSSWSKHTVSPIVFPCQTCMLARATTGMTGWWRGAWPSGTHIHTHIFLSAVVCQPRFS